MMRRRPQTILAANIAAILQAQGSTHVALVQKLNWAQDRLDSLVAGTLNARLDEIDDLASALNALPVDLMCDLSATRPAVEYAR